MSTLKGLNDRMEILNELRFYLRHEQKLLSEGWLTESDFLAIVDRLIREYAAIILNEKWQRQVSGVTGDLLLKISFS